MTDGFRIGKHAHRPWAACPNCSADLGAKAVGGRLLHTYCPFCGVEITFVWWQRVIVSTFGLILAFAVPASLGIRGMALIFAGALLAFPALVLSIILVFKTIRPKYVWKPGAPITLFQRNL